MFLSDNQLHHQVEAKTKLDPYHKFCILVDPWYTHLRESK